MVARQHEFTATPRDLERLQYRVLAAVTESLDQVWLTDEYGEPVQLVASLWPADTIG